MELISQNGRNAAQGRAEGCISCPSTPCNPRRGWGVSWPFFLDGIAISSQLVVTCVCCVHRCVRRWLGRDMTLCHNVSSMILALVACGKTWKNVPAEKLVVKIILRLYIFPSFRHPFGHPISQNWWRLTPSIPCVLEHVFLKRSRQGAVVGLRRMEENFLGGGAVIHVGAL